MTAPRKLRDSAPIALPAAEAVDSLDAESLVALLTQLGGLTERARARLMRTKLLDTLSSPPCAPSDEWLKPHEAATYLKVPVSWVREKARRGMLRSHRRGHYVRFLKRELNEDLLTLETLGD